MGLLILLVVLVALIVIFGLWAAGVYNGLIRLRNLVQESWRQIDVELKRRHDLIPNLVETVRAYAAHERQALDSVVAARSVALSGGGSVPQQVAAEGALSAALGRLFAVAESYPDLKANQSFLGLQAELTETEDRVAAGRRFYNANVRELNTRIESVPANLFASAFHFGRADYFEIADVSHRDAPQVNLLASGATPALGPGGEYTVPGSTQYEPSRHGPQYGQPPHGAPQYGQPPHGTPQYGQTPHGTPQS